MRQRRGFQHSLSCENGQITSHFKSLEGVCEILFALSEIRFRFHQVRERSFEVPVRFDELVNGVTKRLLYCCPFSSPTNFNCPGSTRCFLLLLCFASQRIQFRFEKAPINSLIVGGYTLFHT